MKIKKDKKTGVKKCIRKEEWAFLTQEYMSCYIIDGSERELAIPQTHNSYGRESVVLDGREAALVSHRTPFFFFLSYHQIYIRNRVALFESSGPSTRARSDRSS